MSPPHTGDKILLGEIIRDSNVLSEIDTLKQGKLVIHGRTPYIYKDLVLGFWYCTQDIVFSGQF
jgi:hypothetical protein